MKLTVWECPSDHDGVSQYTGAYAVLEIKDCEHDRPYHVLRDGVTIGEFVTSLKQDARVLDWGVMT